MCYFCPWRFLHKEEQTGNSGEKQTTQVIVIHHYPRLRTYFSTPVAACVAVVFADVTCFAIYLATPVTAVADLTCFSKYLETPVPAFLFKYFATPVKPFADT